jgi:hypothetical protein
MYAAMYGRKEVIELLLNHEAESSVASNVRGNDDDDGDHSLNRIIS